MPRKNPGKRSAGGSRPVQRRPTVNDRPVAFEPDPRVVALLRAIWARRAELRSESTREMIRSFLEQVRRRPLTDPQLNAAANVGRTLAIGFDDPRLDDPKPVPGQRTVQPWGPLPLRPPGR